MGHLERRQLSLALAYSHKEHAGYVSAGTFISDPPYTVRRKQRCARARVLAYGSVPDVADVEDGEMTLNCMRR